MAHGFGYGDGSCVDLHQRHVVRVFSALCPLAVSSVAAGLGSRLGLLGLFVLVFCFFCLIKK